MNGNGRPRVGRSPYDTTDPATAQLLSRLEHTREGTPEAENLRALAGPQSGFFDRLLADYFTHGSIPVRLKDVGKAMFGTPTEESTQTWGDSTDSLSFTSGAAEVLATTSQLAIHVNRPRPTTFTILTTIDVSGAGWLVEGQTSFVIRYTVGVGLTHTTIVKTFVIPAVTRPGQLVLDVTTAPLQSLVANVSMDATNNNVNVPHAVLVTMLAAPVVQ